MEDPFNLSVLDFHLCSMAKLKEHSSGSGNLNSNGEGKSVRLIYELGGGAGRQQEVFCKKLETDGRAVLSKCLEVMQYGSGCDI